MAADIPGRQSVAIHQHVAGKTGLPEGEGRRPGWPFASTGVPNAAHAFRDLGLRPHCWGAVPVDASLPGLGLR